MMSEGDTAQYANTQTLGRYRLLKCAGRGGMGEVWLGEDPRLHRQVAIKTLPTHSQSDREFSLRFEREAQAAAALNHPHILPVYDYGEQLLPNGQVITYIVMPFIQGGSLADRITNYKNRNMIMSPQETLTYLRQAAEAIDYAHEQGVIHRDIKPGNILLRNDNWILLADFGIARILSNTDNLTQTGTGFGTPEYMAPEQALGKAVASSDNYSLAVIAYYLLTGRLPFKAETGYATTIQHMTMSPPPPRQCNPDLSPATETALLQGLAKEPSQRPPTAQAFVATLQQSFPNMAYHISQVGSSPYSTGGGPSTPDITTALSQTGQHSVIEQPVSTGQHPTTGQPLPASQNSFNNQNTIVNTIPNNSTTNPTPTISRRKLVIGGIAGATLIAGGTWLLLQRNMGQSQTSNQSNSSATQNTPDTPQTPIVDPKAPALVLRAHIDPAHSLAWTSQKNTLILASASKDKQVMLWSIQKLQQEKPSKPKYEIQHEFTYGSSMQLAWSPDGKYLAIGNASDEKTGNVFTTAAVSIYNGDLSAPASGFESPRIIQGGNSISDLAWTQSKYLVSAMSSLDLIDKRQFQLNIWDVTQPKLQWEPILVSGRLPAKAESAQPALVASADGSLLAVVTGNGIQIGQLTIAGNAPTWQFLTDVLKIKEDSFPPRAKTVAWSPDGTFIASFATDIKPATLAIWNWKEKPKEPFNFLQAKEEPTTLAWSPAPASRLIAMGYKDGSVRLWKPDKSNLPIMELNTGGIKAEIIALSWSEDGQWLAASLKDNYASILVWKVEVRG